MDEYEQRLHDSLAEVVMAFSQQKRSPWTTLDIAMVQRAQAALAMHPDHEEGNYERHPYMRRPWNQE